MAAEDSVDGVADTDHQAIAGNFNQLRKLKAHYPDINILISLGGWTWSDYFSEAASTPESREKLVDSCLDLYIEGNVPTYEGKGGDGAAAGIFDGIDIDWEWPVTGGETPNATPEDAENFIALMAEFRAELDALGEQNSERYLLSAFAPVGGWNTQGGWRDARIFESVDFLNVQGYDYHGGWVPNQTGHQGNLWPDGDNNWGLALAPELQAYLDAGARPDQLNAGLAAYGHGWYGVQNGNAAWQDAEGYIGTATYADLRETGERHFDPETGAAWIFVEGTGGDDTVTAAEDDGAPEGASQWWSLDTPASVTAKAEHIAAAGYGGAMWWDLSGDYQNELGNALGTTLRASEMGPLSAPTLSSGHEFDIAVGDDIAVDLSVRGAGPLDIAVVSGELPAGLELDGHSILGTATEPGTFTAQLIATNAFGESAPVTFAVTVAQAPGSGEGEETDPGDEEESDSGSDAEDEKPSGSSDADAAADAKASADDSENAGSLPRTGADPSGLFALALVLVLLGGGAIVVRRRMS
ncbi:glycosyl hydrolase family 18 protein [Microbacterium sp. MPKO10]|uniref:glycosyl hydrolase family 18 protein n=1 Tax=Microbacterium sp. MPKO10 TaxID=2989818 RepID=UPI0022368E37|nr:glycosyl hydrolase family 18 protein [Microbacterium sp. MPKO10]MCW4457769.1 glycosyl hydrolase family 18 protein [Microbacterium sp. MPKO10]